MSNNKKPNKIVVAIIVIAALLLCVLAARGCAHRNIGRTLSSITEAPINVSIRSNERFGDCFAKSFPKLARLHKDIGGAKLLGEIFADANNKHMSKCDENADFSCPPLSALGLSIDDSECGITNKIYNNAIKVEVSPVESHGYFSGYFTVDVWIENQTDKEQEVIIRQGLLIETLGDDVQNLVVKKTEIARVAGHEKQMIRVSAYCASKHRGSPTGYRVRFTPFYLFAESSNYYSNDSIWKWQESKYEEYRRNSR